MLDRGSRETSALTVRAARDRLRRVDPLVAVCGVVALTVYVLQGFDGVLTTALGVYAYGGQQVAEGVPPFVAILNRVGPLAHLVPGIGAGVARLVGVDDILGMRVTLMLVSVVAVMVVYLLGRDLFRSRAAGLASAAALLCSEGFLLNATFGPREKTTMVCFLALALLAMVHQRWGTAGAMIALSTLTWQPVFFPALAGVAVAAVLRAPDGGRGRLVALSRIAVGGVIPTAITVLAYAAVGRLQIFLDAFLLINLRYTTVAGLQTNPGVVWEKMTDGYGWSLWVMILGTLIILAMGTHAAIQHTRTASQGASLVGLGAFVVVCALWSFKDFDGWMDAFLLLPVAAAGIGGIVALLAQRVPVRALTAGVVAWCLVATGMAVVTAIGNRSDALDRQRADGDTVMAMLPANADIISVSAPQALVVTRQRNPSRLQMFAGGLDAYVEDTWPGGLKGYGRWIGTRSPTVIAVGSRGKEPCCPDWLEDVVKQDYQKVGSTPGPFRWFVNKRISRQTRAEIQAMLDAR